MAPPLGTLRVGRYFGALIVLLGLLYLVVFFPGNRHSPKLGIDLVGGQRAIFTARTTNGTAPSSDSMNQARQIIEDRVNGQGVTGSTVQIQGGNQLVVLIPGGTGTSIQELGQPAILNFRGLVAPAAAVSCVSGAKAAAGSATPTPTTSGSAASPTTSTSSTPTTPTTSPTSPTSPTSTTSPTAAKASGAGASAGSGTASDAPDAARHRVLAAAPSATPVKSSAAKPKTSATKATPTGASTSAGASAATTPAPSATSSAAPRPCLKDPLKILTTADPKLKIPTTEAQYTALTSTQQQEIQAALANYKCSSAVSEADNPNSYYVACDNSGLVYLLGTVIVPGSQISSAASEAPGASGQGVSSEWAVNLNLKSRGNTAWAAWTGKYNVNTTGSGGSVLQCGGSSGEKCSNFVGFTLNGAVITTPPETQGAINGGQTQITGNFSQTSADALATQLNYGSLPLSFKLDSNESVSATLGTVQLKAALLAGGIGLVLVVIYSLAYYRGLGIVTIASLLVSAGLTFAMLVILGTQIGFTLDLAGIAGFIVALGITADSFVVFFERIKDEVHEGRSMRVAVPRAWIRARRTILSADTVSFLAAAILYYFASADVKGFAFTLGMSTILDLVVVFLFTHPIVSLLSRSATFGSPRFTGLNSVRTGGIVDSDEPATRRRPARTQAAGRRAGEGSTATALRSRKRTTVEPEFDGSDDQLGGVDDDPTAVDDTSIDEPRVTPDQGEIADDTTRGTSAGTAAERAAARRARLRSQQDDEGKA